MSTDQPALNPAWPVLRRYRGEHLRRVAMPIGGIGTGTVSLGGRGNLRDWEIVNRPAKGFVPNVPITRNMTEPRAFFAARVQVQGHPPVTRLLEGDLDPVEYEGTLGSPASHHGLPRFADASFHTAYPLAQVCLRDPDVPVDLRLEAFNPLIPGRADDSGLPVAVLRWMAGNPSDVPMQVSVCAVLANFIGTDGKHGQPKRNVNRWRLGNGLRGLDMRSDGVPADAEQWGTLALTVLDAPDQTVTARTAWYDVPWGDALLDFWEDFSADGRLDDRPPGAADSPTASLAATVDLAPGQDRAVTFLLAWHFPNRLTWDVMRTGDDRADWVGNHYAARVPDAWTAAEDAAARLPDLERDTVRFVRAFCDADIPDAIKEAALFNLSTLRSQTAFRSADGGFYGFEGCFDDAGAGFGTCTHVWNYEHATGYLFGDLARGMRDVEFNESTASDGHMEFRAALPRGRASAWGLAAADGQLGCLVKLYRDWQLSGDDDFLRRLWPGARRALEFCWIEGGWDADRDGVMEGCQHNTMDVEYFGPNPEIGGWYLAALRAGEEMAAHVGETEFAAECRRLFEQGRAWIDANLFNGDYFEHQIRPQPDRSRIAPGLRRPEKYAAQNLEDPEHQVGSGCLVGQLVGQAAARLGGLGPLLDPDHVAATLRSIMRHNFRPSMRGHVNHFRSYALADEAGLVIAAYPRGDRPERPFPYCNEVWSGLEYTAAVGMLQEGQPDAALQVIEAVRARHDGARRNPFDEPEYGHHYARAMAAWGAVVAVAGFGYSAVRAEMRFAADPGTAFWSNGSAWGTCTRTKNDHGWHVRLDVLGGEVRLRAFELTDVGRVEFDAGCEVHLDSPLTLHIPA
ncbi:MAG: GH116 family glycosyl-hydrolase [Chloroflexi bacterium]|nr:GH116 family glycosyl-hydrolase [Chloroflexota bacterium]